MYPTNAEIAPSLVDLAACGVADPCSAVYTTIQRRDDRRYPDPDPAGRTEHRVRDRLSQLDLRLTKILRFGRTRVRHVSTSTHLQSAAVLTTIGAYARPSSGRRP